jgi:hypothetical protein
MEIEGLDDRPRKGQSQRHSLLRLKRSSSHQNEFGGA